MGKITLSIVIPAYNEESNIQAVVQEHALAAQDLQSEGFLERWELLCLNDASSDGTLHVLKQLQANIPQLRLMTHAQNQGIYMSFRDLFLAAQQEYIYVTGGDGQWPAENLKCLCRKLAETQSDLVVGVRRNRWQVYGFWRNILSYGFNLIPALFFRCPTLDANGIKLGKSVLFRLPLKSQSYFSEIERILEARRGKYKIVFEDIIFLPRPKGKARGAQWKYILATLRDFFKYLK